MSTLEELLKEKAHGLREFWFDVDGVMTPQGGVTIYEVHDQNILRHFHRSEGIDSVRLVPCDEQGNVISHAIEYLAGYAGEPVMEGYRFDTRDGKVIEYLVDNGFPVYFISGRNSACVRKRALALGAVPLLGVKDKLTIIRDTMKCSLDEVLFVGDGIQDVETLRATGFSIAPADASPEAIAAAHCTTIAHGGAGVLHEAITHFLKVRNMWPS